MSDDLLFGFVFQYRRKPAKPGSDLGVILAKRAARACMAAVYNAADGNMQAICQRPDLSPCNGSHTAEKPPGPNKRKALALGQTPEGYLSRN